MAGVGAAHGSYGRFQQPPVSDQAEVDLHVHRLAIGVGMGYEVYPPGPFALGVFFRAMNTLGSWQQGTAIVENRPPVRKGNSVLYGLGASLAWR